MIGLGIGVAVPLYAYFRYVRKTKIENRQPVDSLVYDDRSRFLIEQENTRRYTSALEQRAIVAAELVRSGRQPDEISSLLDKSLPFPEKLEFIPEKD